MPLDLLFAIERYPAGGSKLDATSLTVQGGGPVPNVLVGLSRLGMQTALITAVADDVFGKQGMAEIEREGVDIRWLVKKVGVSDCAAGLIEKTTGERTMILHRKIHVRPKDIVTSRLPKAGIVHLDGRDLDACIKLARWGRSIGAITCFDIGSMRNDVSPIFPLIDHLVVADAYALPFTRCRNARLAASRLAEYGCQVVVVTEGTRGAWGLEDGEFHHQAAFKVKAVDTTGAGDAFHTGYLYGLLKGKSLTERMKLGAAVAALKCTLPGARSGLPSVSKLRTFLRKPPKTYA